MYPDSLPYKNRMLDGISKEPKKNYLKHMQLQIRVFVLAHFEDGAASEYRRSAGSWVDSVWARR